MYTILEKRLLAQNIYLMRIHAPRVARSAKPGQFIIVRIDEFGERIPLTISDYNAEDGSVTIVTQAIGASTQKLCAKNEGEALADFAGPLGHPSEFVSEDLESLRKKRFLFVAGGVGTAPVYPQVKWLKEHGIKADVIIGAKTQSMLIYTDQMREVAENLYIATDDGSEGFKGMVTALIKELIEKEGKKYDVCVAIGPMIMMKFVALTTKEYSLPTIASLNTLMVDGTGMCGACRVTVGGKTVFTCVDGPEFDAHQVDFDEAMRRQGMYRTQEERARAIAQERANGHQCHIGLDK
ncbi:MAG TPA: sulfide/dihydroorotate dehydrogenase-like FAD/NAD-binding protein [Candidatus Alistipes avicola]|uniref:Sulfide/dihydroorotate dehydrogenase-like FAD/NAD-binding protein n=1 Tax=Candidatus Alistipes avicola TaxID=2838432 RepID=A0A9D2IDN5_9BACT|nr:sulfide/dihydroorotate dehydrogenase-like FAD/NAD-binding protein [uncultured Alistipes sp.]HJA98098.1 sulfide/dihydroorotate dehydrogenase-like FAD/NAD-binding protein [Candidatus Alistipes avicola]